MDIDVPVGQSYTILRIKRKRNEEPLDALVVESRRRKKSRGGVGVFQFAQTVEHDAWDDETKKRDIQDQVSRLARENATSSPTAPATEIKGTNAPLNQASSSSAPKDDLARRYKVIMQEDDEPPRRRFPSSPPKVVSAKDLPPQRKSSLGGFKMYDAVLSAEAAAQAAGPDEEMEKFMPMLNDYLKLHDIGPPVPDASNATSLPTSKSSPDDYVWDVFFHRPATLSEWNEAANVGTITGLPPSITDPYDSASDSEAEDEADEDSNAEEYYKNDYPDEEDSSEESRDSDDFYDDSEDSAPYEENDSDHEWR